VRWVKHHTSSTISSSDFPDKNGGSQRRIEQSGPNLQHRAVCVRFARAKLGVASRISTDEARKR
jgi:hypothetical protein